MMMIRRLRLLWATLFALYCGSAFAVGMSELELKSALNQRFDAEIALTNVGALEIDELIPNLASQSDFDRVGVARNYELTDLRFKVVLRETGDYVVQVTSSKPIIEPFLNFIVEVIWPTGRILREYTVLLDPPVFGTQGIEKIDPSESMAPAKSSKNTNKTSSSSRRQIPSAPAVSSGRTEGVVTQDDEYGLTGPGDTLWTIAAKVRPDSSVSVQQTMLALQRANPEAFINNNINLLKAGHVLRIPDLNEIRSANSGQAVAEVQVQNDEFQDYKSGGLTQFDASRNQNRQTDRESAQDDGELKLLASDQSGARSGADDARAAELEDALAVAREDLDRSRRATSEINVRLGDLADQVETLNEIVSLKDDQLAALKAELQKSQSAPQPAPQPAATPAASATSAPAAGLLANPMVLGGVGLALIALIAAALIVMRRRKQDNELPADDFPEVMMEESEPQLHLADAVAEAGAADVASDEEEEEDVTQQTSDVIGEAEIYIAYGRFPQAISFLQNAVENEPDRADVQLKLMEVYVQTEDATAFNLQLEQLRMLGDDDATQKALELQSQIPGAAETSAAAMDATIVSSEPIVAIEEPGDDDDDLSFDLDDLDAETEDDDLSLDLGGDDDAQELSLDEAMELGDAELDLDLDAALEDASIEEADSDLDLDLDLEDEIDLDFDDDNSSDLDATQQLDASGLTDDNEIVLDLDEDLDISLDDDSLDLEDDSLELDDDSLDLDDDSLELDDDSLDLDDTVSLDSDDLDLGDGDALELDLDDDDGLELNLDDDDDDGLELNLDDDDALELNLDDDDDGLELNLDDDDALELNLDDDDGLELNLDDDELSLDLDDDDAISLDLDGDDDIELDLGEDSLELDDDGAIELDLDDDDELDLGDLDDELSLDDDTGSKLDLARAYIEMGDSDGARSLLNEVLGEGSDSEISEANELMGSLD